MREFFSAQLAEAGLAHAMAHSKDAAPQLFSRSVGIYAVVAIDGLSLTIDPKHSDTAALLVRQAALRMDGGHPAPSAAARAFEARLALTGLTLGREFPLMDVVPPDARADFEGLMFADYQMTASGCLTDTHTLTPLSLQTTGWPLVAFVTSFICSRDHGLGTDDLTAPCANKMKTIVHAQGRQADFRSTARRDPTPGRFSLALAQSREPEPEP